MSVDATKFVWSLSKNIVSPLEKLILLAIADRCGERGECWPIISRLATDTGLDKRSIVRHRNKLINQKILRYTGEFKGRSNQIPVMQIMVDEWREGDYIEDEIDQGQGVTSDTQTLVPGAACHGYQGQAVIRNLKEEPIKESNITNTSKIHFSEYKNLENNLDPQMTKKAEYKKCAIHNERSRAVFNELWLNLDVTIEEAYDVCQEWWDLENGIANWSAFVRFLKNPKSREAFEPVSKSTNSTAIKETEEERQKRYQKERKDSGFK
jgi:hypothetical protein